MVPFLKKGILPSIPVAEQTPTVRLLMTLVEQQQVVIDSQQRTIEQLQLQIDRLRSSNEQLQQTL